MTSTFETDRFREAMRRTASGVAVVTTAGHAGRAGLTVSSLCSLSMEPPSVVLSVHKDSRALATMLENGQFVANILAQHQERVANVFAGLVPEMRENRFAVADWDDLDSGLPALADALCNFECRVAGVFEFGTHRIIAGEVLGLRMAEARPLVFCDRGFHQIQALQQEACT
ncbi:flavin reductase family protein [Roseibium marinum]|uniref:Flavin reductase n=1 Tax=Roseibium marinum TaxID=281252 RepID=A0A2S3UTF0_9HYPH|nr:flavin reductase family protein [Roseibium marinum]POF30934.1 flavin reductase [Roseibium marinum]